MESTLWVDPSGGISCEKFAAALIGLGVPESGMMHAMEAAAGELGLLDVHAHVEFLPNGSLAHRLHITFLEQRKPLSLEYAADKLNEMLSLAEVEGEYAVVVKRALSILSTAETQSVSAASSPHVETVQLSVIGEANTPYEHKAPYQPALGNVSDGVFFIQIAPQFIAGLKGLETFSHILVFAYLDRSRIAKIRVRPPWTEGQDEYGVFATRSPNRPSPIGLSRTRLERIEGDRIYTGPLDLFNHTPIVDIKPFIRSLDTADRPAEEGNDGWLQGSDHLELHRLGIPHEHPESSEGRHKIERRRRPGFNPMRITCARGAGRRVESDPAGHHGTVSYTLRAAVGGRSLPDRGWRRHPGSNCAQPSNSRSNRFGGSESRSWCGGRELGSFAVL